MQRHKDKICGKFKPKIRGPKKQVLGWSYHCPRDKIRGKFKPKVRGPKKQATEQFSNNLTQEVEQKLQNILSLKNTKWHQLY